MIFESKQTRDRRREQLRKHISVWGKLDVEAFASGKEEVIKAYLQLDALSQVEALIFYDELKTRTGFTVKLNVVEHELLVENKHFANRHYLGQASGGSTLISDENDYADVQLQLQLRVEDTTSYLNDLRSWFTSSDVNHEILTRRVLLAPKKDTRFIFESILSENPFSAKLEHGDTDAQIAWCYYLLESKTALEEVREAFLRLPYNYKLLLLRNSSDEEVRIYAGTFVG